MSSYANFSTKNLKMRPAADKGDPNNENTVCWSHYKGTATDVTNSEDASNPASYKYDNRPWDFRCITNNLQKLQWYNNNDTTYMNGYTVNRYEGWFYVTPENADKEWTFRSQYDDRAALWIDGIDTGLTGASGNTLTKKMTLSLGWHKFRIQTADFTGSAGPWSGKGLAVSYQVGSGAQTLFSEQTLRLSVCPDGYIQGGVTLASNATLSNNATENAAVVYGDVTATGTGATMSGAFKFEGAKLAYENVAPAARDLSAMLDFENASADMLADLGGIAVDFASDPTVGTLVVCPAYGLSMTDLEVKVPVAVTVNGQPLDKKYKARVNGGNIEIVFRSASVIYIR
jgi:hypothetical protein